MMDRRIEQEELPPLPDDFDAAASAHRQAERRLSEAREGDGWIFPLLEEARQMRLHNGWGPMLERAYQLRGNRT